MRRLPNEISTLINFQPEDGLKMSVANVCYQSCAELKRMMYSCIDEKAKRTVDMIMVLDGCFRFLLDKRAKKIAGITEEFSPYSNDGTIQMIETFKAEQKESGSRGIKVYYEVYNGNEFEKRQRYLELAQLFKLNAIIIVDSDEYFYEDPRLEVTKDWDAFRARVKECLFLQTNVFSMDIIHSEYGGRDPHKRVWLYPEQMTYWQGSHYKFLNPNDHDFERLELSKHLGRQPAFLTFRQVTLKHDHNLRTDQQFHFRRLYQNYLVNYEYLLESGYSIEESNNLAIVRMKDLHWKDPCTCRRCVLKNKIDPRMLFDQRPKRLRGEFDPFGDIKEKIKQDPEFEKTLTREI